jgi:hypothetical protein
MGHMDILCMQIVFGENIDTVEKAAEATGFLIINANKAEYTAVVYREGGRGFNPPP